MLAYTHRYEFVRILSFNCVERSYWHSDYFENDWLHKNDYNDRKKASVFSMCRSRKGKGRVIEPLPSRKIQMSSNYMFIIKLTKICFRHFLAKLNNRQTFTSPLWKHYLFAHAPRARKTKIIPQIPPVKFPGSLQLTVFFSSLELKAL